MHKCYVQKALLCALIASASTTSHTTDFFKNPTASATTAGAACLVLGGSVAYWLGKNNANAKYAFKENQAQRAAEERKEQEARNQEQAREQKLHRDRLAFERAENMAKQFANLYTKYGHIPSEDLAGNADFQREIEAAVVGTNDNPKRLETLNARATDIRESLFQIDSDTLSEPEKERKATILTIINWATQQANSSDRVHATQQELSRQHLEFEHTQHMNRIAAEKAMQEKIKTESLEKECKHRIQAAKALEQTANDLHEQLYKLRGNVQEQLYNIGHALKERLDSLNAWQANRAQEHAETRQQFHALQAEYARVAQLSATLENACNDINHLIKNLESRLTRIESKQDTTLKELQTLLHIAKSIPDALDKKNAQQIHALEQRLIGIIKAAQQNAQYASPLYPQPSAPEMPASKGDSPLDPADETE